MKKGRKMFRLLMLSIFYTGFICCFTYSQQPTSLPRIVPDSNFHQLRESISPALTSKLTELVEKNKLWKKLVLKKKMSLGVVILTHPANPEVAWINPNLTMYAASLPKLAILLTAVHEFEYGSRAETPELLDDLTKMIRESDNAAATRVIDSLGLAKIQEVLTSPQFKFYNEEKGGGLWVGKRFAKKGRKVPDPIKNLSHAANVRQVCRFYYLLATGRIINPERSKQILEILSKPGIDHKFVKTLGIEYPLKRLYRKSGTWKRWHSDSILVWGKDSRMRYILVGLVEHQEGEKILQELADLVNDLLAAF